MLFFGFLVSDTVDVLQHLMIELVDLVFEEATDFTTGEIDLVLCL